MRRARWFALGLVSMLLALLALPGSGAGQDSSHWAQFETGDGLPSDTVWSIAADPQGGDVWVGTSQGASLYRDGQWYSYSEAHGLGAEWVAALAVDGQQRTWFGTFGGGLTVLNGETWHTYNTANSGIGCDWVSALAVNELGRVWCGTWGHGVSLFSGEGDAGGDWLVYYTGNSPLPSDYVTAVAMDGSGTLWVGLHGEGLARLAEGRWTLFGPAQGLPDPFVEALATGPDGRLYVGTAKGLAVLDAAGHPLRTYTTDNGLPSDHIHALAFDNAGRLWAGTNRGAASLADDVWTAYRAPGTLAHDYVSAIAATAEGVWFGSLSNGVSRYGSGAEASTRRLPVVLVHGWHGPDSDRLEDSEFRFLANWLQADGYPVYYAQGISPQNTLHENAAHLRQAIERAKSESGAAKVDIIAFSMGGLNTRAYVESNLYAGDVDQAFILGTPQAGVRIWYPFLLREFQQWARDPSAVELTPEYAELFNGLHANNGSVPYYLIAGDARHPELPETLRGLPAGDALISVGSAFALEGQGMHKILTDDLHAWSDETILAGIPSLLYPRRTYDAYIRNHLRLGPGTRVPGVAEAEAPDLPLPETPMHSPFYEGEVAPGETVTQTVLVDTRGEVSFYLRGEAGALSYSLIDPSGNRIDAESIGERGEHFDLGMANVQNYLIHRAQPGAWQVVIGRPEDAAGATRFAGYAVFSSALRLTASASPEFLNEGEPVNLVATLQRGDQAVPQARVEAEIGRPDMTADRLVLFDDGEHGDGEAHDGVYGATYHPPKLGGYYTLFVTAQGTSGGVEFARTAERLFAVSPGTALLTGSYAEAGEDANRDGRFDALTLQAGVDVRAGGSYLLAATLSDAEGREICRVVEPLALDPGPQTVNVRFPGRMIASGEADGPYTVSRVMLLDETEAAVPLQEDTGVLTTRAYRYQDFER